ncbi:MAG: hypothetical protein ACJ76Z_11265 [Thermoleophilaceae bacterium]
MRFFLRYIVCLAALFALLGTGVAVALPSLAANPANKLLARGLDPIRYDRATHCNGGKIQAGTKAMLTWLERNASGVNWGEYRCEMWGKHEASLHSEGRAIDWHPSSAGAAKALVKLLLAPDKNGNAAALARRMGVQGLIFDCRSWFGNWDGRMGDYSYCYTKSGKRKAHLDPTQAHMNHVHIELNKLGAAMRTTFWNKSVRYPVQEPAPQVPPRQPSPGQEPAQTAPPQPQDPRYGNGGSGWNGGGNWNGGGGQYGGSPPR